MQFPFLYVFFSSYRHTHTQKRRDRFKPAMAIVYESNKISQTLFPICTTQIFITDARLNRFKCIDAPVVDLLSIIKKTGRNMAGQIVTEFLKSKNNFEKITTILNVVVS